MFVSISLRKCGVGGRYLKYSQEWIPYTVLQRHKKFMCLKCDLTHKYNCHNFAFPLTPARFDVNPAIVHSLANTHYPMRKIERKEKERKKERKQEKNIHDTNDDYLLFLFIFHVYFSPDFSLSFSLFFLFLSLYFSSRVRSTRSL